METIYCVGRWENDFSDSSVLTTTYPNVYFSSYDLCAAMCTEFNKTIDSEDKKSFYYAPAESYLAD